MENLLTNAPITFIFCFNKECSKKKDCLHFQAGSVQVKRPIITTVNYNVTTNCGDVCPYFKKIEIKEYIKGMTQLYDNIPMKQVDGIRNELVSHFGKTTYYRYIKGEKLLSPEEQQYISQVFIHQGITQEPQYDEHFNSYNWDD